MKENNHHVILKFIVSIMLLSVILTTKAQNKTAFVDNYTFFGVHGSFNEYKKGNTNYHVNDSPVTVYHDKVPSYSVGVTFQVYKTDKFLFQTGFNSRHIYEGPNYYIDKSQTDSNRPDVYQITSDFGDNIYNVPLRAEYLFYKKWMLFSSIIPGYYKEYGGWGYHRIDDIEIYEGYPASNDWFHLNTEIGLGVYIPGKYVLIQPYIYYNKNYTELREGSLKITGIKERSYTEINGSFSQSGDHIGFGLNFYPKKLWKMKKTSNF